MTFGRVHGRLLASDDGADQASRLSSGQIYRCSRGFGDLRPVRQWRLRTVRGRVGRPPAGDVRLYELKRCGRLTGTTDRRDRERGNKMLELTALAVTAVTQTCERQIVLADEAVEVTWRHYTYDPDDIWFLDVEIVSAARAMRERASSLA